MYVLRSTQCSMVSQFFLIILVIQNTSTSEGDQVGLVNGESTVAALLQKDHAIRTDFGGSNLVYPCQTYQPT